MASKHDKNIKITVSDNGQLKKATGSVDKLNSSINNANSASKKAAKGAQTLDRNIKGAGQQSANSAKNFSKMAQGMQGVLVPAYAEVAARVFALTAAYTALQRAADFSVLMKGQTAYARLTGKNMGSIAKEIQETSGYMLDFQKASQFSALASTAGLTIKQINKMTKGARAASVALGRDMTDSMDRLTRGIVKAEPEILDEIGVIIRLDTVYKDYAKSIGKTTTELTEFEKLTARTNAILGQVEDKFGAIAESVPANAFSKLAASVLDMAKEGGALISDFLSPVARFLADSPALLGLLMAIITKNVIGKALPALKGLGDAFADLPNKIDKSLDRIGKKADSLSKKRDMFKKMLGKPKDMEKDLRNVLSKLDIKPSSKLSEALGKSITGKEFRNAIERSIRAAVGAGTAKVSRGQPIGGMFKGDASLMHQLNDAFKKFDKSLNATNKSMRGLVGVEFLNWVNNASQGALYLADAAGEGLKGIVNFSKRIFNIASNEGAVAGFKALHQSVRDSSAQAVTGIIMASNSAKGAIPGVTGLANAFNTLKFSMASIWAVGKGVAKVLGGTVLIAATKLVQSLNLITFAIGAFSMLKWLGEEIIGLSKHMEAARGAADALSNSLDSVNDRITEAQNINFDGYAKDLTESIKNSEFASNVAEEISRSLRKAVTKIDMDLINGAGFKASLSRGVDSLYSIFGGGLEDSLGESLSKALEVQMSQNLGLSKKTMNQLTSLTSGSGVAGILDILTKLEAGARLSTNEVERLEEAFTTVGNKQGMVRVLTDITEAQEAFAAKTKEAAKTVEQLRTATVKYNQDRLKFVKDLVKGSEFEELAKDFKELRALMDSSVSGADKVLALEEAGVLPTASKDVQAYINKLELLRDISNQLSEAQLQQADNTDYLASRKARLEKGVKKLGDALFKHLGFGTKGTGAVLAALYGQDPEEANNRAITLASDVEKIGRLKLKYAKLGDVALSKQATLEKNILWRQQNQLKNKLKFAKDGELTAAETQSIINQIEVYEDKMAEVTRHYEKTAAYSKDLLGLSLNLSDTLASKRLDVLGPDFEDDTLEKMDLLEKFEEFEFNEVTKAFNLLNNSISSTFEDTTALVKVMDVLNNALKKGLINPDKYSKVLKQWQLHFTNQGKVIKDRNKAITEELQLISVQTNHWTEHTDLIEARERMAKMDLEVSDKLLQKDKERLKLRELYLTLAKQEADLKIAKFEESMQGWADAMASVADSFDQTLSGFISDWLMGKETDTDWRTVIAQSLSDSAGNIVSGVATKAVFGNEGLLAGAGKHVFGMDDKDIDAIFPKTDVQILEGSIVSVERAILAQRAILEQTRDYTNTVASTVKNGSIGTTESQEGLTKLSSSISQVKVSAPVVNIKVDTSEIVKGIDKSITSRLNNMIDSSGMGEGYKASPKNLEFLKQMFPKGAEESVDSWNKRLEKHLLEYEQGIKNYLDKSGSSYNITPSNMSAGLTSDIDYTNMDWAQKQIHGGINPSVEQTLSSIDAHVAQSQKFLTDLASKTLDSIDTLVSFDIGVPLEEAALDISLFVDTIDNKFVPVLDKLNPILDSLPTLITELTLSIKGVNDLFGFGKETSKDTAWYEKIFDSTEKTSKILEEEQGPNSFSVYDKTGAVNSKALKEAMTKMPKGFAEALEKSVGKQLSNLGIYKDANNKYARVGERLQYNSPEWKKLQAEMGSRERIYRAKLVSNELQKISDGQSRVKAKLGQGELFDKNGKSVGAHRAGPFSTAHPYEGSNKPGKGMKMFHDPKSPNSSKFWYPGTEPKGYTQGKHPSVIEAQKLQHAQQLERIEAKKAESLKIEKDNLRYNEMIEENKQRRYLEEREARKLAENIEAPKSSGIVNKLMPFFEKLNSVLMMIMPNDNIIDNETEMEMLNQYDSGSGALKVLEQNPDAQKDGTPIAPIPVSNPTGDYTTDKMSKDLRESMASNLHTQIMNDNMNARALLTNSLSTVSSNLMSSAIGSIFGLANGGVVSGGFRAFANGGTVKEPTLGLVGEGRYNEAVVPLPDGRSIPVTGNMGSENNVTVNVTIDSDGNAKSDTNSGINGDQAKQLGYMISQAVQSELVEQQRPGGLLSQY